MLRSKKVTNLALCMGTIATLLVLVSATAAGAGPASEVARDGEHRLELLSGSPSILSYTTDDGARTVLRRTENQMSAVQLVDASIGNVIFATWREGAPAAIGTDMTALSIDGGTKWTAAREESYTLPLRPSHFAPFGAPPRLTPGLPTASSESTLYIVQFHTRSLLAWRQQLEKLGAEVHWYLRGNAHLVRMSPAVRSAVERQRFVRWIAPYQPSYRVGDWIREQLNSSEPTANASRFRLVSLTSNSSEKRLLADELEALGGRTLLLTDTGSIIEAELTLDQVVALSSSNHLAWIDRWGAPEADMDIVRQAFGADNLDSVRGYDGTGLNAEVMDVGIDTSHQDFDGLIEHGGPAAGGSHGTSTYGIVFSNGDRDTPSDGDPKALGLLPFAQGYYANSGIADRMAHTLELNDPQWQAVFQSNSWGSPRNLSYDSVSQEMDDIVLQSDVLIFQSQSNSGSQMSRPQAWAKNLVSVGGFNHRDTADTSDDCWCGGASIGPAEDGRIKPDLAHFYDATYTTTNSNGYTNFSGTSGATPITAGLSGYFYQMWADNVWLNNPAGTSIFEKRPHPSTLKALLINTADQFPFSGPTDDMTRVHQGWGVVNAQNAFDRADLTKIINETSPLAELEQDSYIASVPAGQAELKVTMVYTDWPGSASSSQHRINDLSLRVVDPNGNEYFGNVGLEDDVWSLTGGQKDTINNVENVFVQNPTDGIWSIEVIADEVVEDVHVETATVDQDYALVVWGVTVLNDCGSLVTPPTNAMATPTNDNEITVTWTGTAPEYRILRAEGGCSGAFQPLATVAAPGQQYIDTSPSGGVNYGYIIRSVDGCESEPTACVEAITTGECFLDAQFAGVTQSSSPATATCGIDIAWDPATSACGGSLVYNIYRSTDPVFTPDLTTRIASCLATTNYNDTNNLTYAQDYYYIVRAEDLASGPPNGPCGGREESNLVRILETPLGPETVAYETDFESGIGGWISDASTPAATGLWVAGDPVGTLNGAEEAQPEDDHTPTGTSCIYTGENPTGDPEDEDVEGGVVRATSPTIDASTFATLRLEFWRWYYDSTPGGFAFPRYFLQASNDGGANWTNLEGINDNAPSETPWTEVVMQLESLISLTSNMQFRFNISGQAIAGEIVEMAMDDFRLLTNGACNTVSTAPWLLRDDAWRSGDSPGLYLPLDVTADRYQQNFNPGSVDPDPVPGGILSDASRPLVFYAWDNGRRIQIVKDAGDVKIY